jgi:peroxiredoxin Q/BCP
MYRAERRRTSMDELRMPEVGEQAPPVSRPTAAGGLFELSDHQGRWVVVYFYPKANTPG